MLVLKKINGLESVLQTLGQTLNKELAKRSCPGLAAELVESATPLGLRWSVDSLHELISFCFFLFYSFIGYFLISHVIPCLGLPETSPHPIPLPIFHKVLPSSSPCLTPTFCSSPQGSKWRLGTT